MVSVDDRPTDEIGVRLGLQGGGDDGGRDCKGGRVGGVLECVELQHGSMTWIFFVQCLQGSYAFRAGLVRDVQFPGPIGGEIVGYDLIDLRATRLYCDFTERQPRLLIPA